MQIALPVAANARCRGNQPAVISKYCSLDWAAFAGNVAKFAGVLSESGVRENARVAVHACASADGARVHTSSSSGVVRITGMAPLSPALLAPLPVAGQFSSSSGQVEPILNFVKVEALGDNPAVVFIENRVAVLIFFDVVD
jgi:hypothetical protein